MATRLIMIRHGESEDNARGSIQGRGPGTGLTERGKRQAEAVAEKLKDEKIAVIYSRTAKRTIETAEIINKHHNLEINIKEFLKDRDFGVLIGTPSRAKEMTKEQLEMHRRRKEEENYKIPEGESFIEVKERIHEPIKNILEEHKDKIILIVSHGNTIRSIVADIMNIPISETYKMATSKTCSYTEIKINGKPELITYFCGEHLTDI